jgi:uncharacterized protein YjiS (DUF1127 family)
LNVQRTGLAIGAAHHPPAFPRAHLLGRGAGALVRLVMTFLAESRRRRQRAAAIRKLRAWDDRMLKDIGLTRGEIIAAVDGRLDRRQLRRWDGD